MRTTTLATLTLLFAISGAAAGPVEDLEKELTKLEARLIELTMNSLEARFARPGGPVFSLYDIADLTVPLTDFIAPNPALKPAGSEFDEESPQFGSAREGLTFFEPDELEDILRRNIRPAVWDAGGALEVRGANLVVSAPKETQAEIRETLRALRVNLGRVVTVRVRAIEADLDRISTGTMSAAERDALLARLAAGDGGRVLASAEVSGYAGQRIVAFDGRQRAFVQDYDVEVAEKSSIADPIVSILQTGLRFSVRAIPQGWGQGVLLDLRASYGLANGDPRVLKTSVGALQLPRLRRSAAHTTITVPDGGALLCGGASSSGKGGSRIAFLVEADITSVAAGKGGAEPDRAGTLRAKIAASKRLIAAYELSARERGVPFRMKLFAVDDLLFAPRDLPGPILGLTPSGAGGFEEDDLDEGPVEVFEPDQLVEMIRTNVAPGSWDELLTTNIEVSGHNLVVTHTPSVLARVSEFLRALRAHASRLVALDVQVVGIADADRQALAAGGPYLDVAARTRLAAWIAEGRVERLHSGRILARNNQRIALTDLEPVSYVYDYDVEIAQEAAIPDPLIQMVRLGLVVDARPVIAGSGSHVVMEIRMRRMALVGTEIPTFPSEVGEIEVPHVEFSQLGCTLTCPIHASVIVGGGLTPTGAGGKGKTRRPLLLVTPRILDVRGR